MIKEIILSSLAMLAVSPQLKAEALFDNGKSAWAICLPSNADSTVKYAAKELQTALLKSSGVKLKIINKAQAQAKHIIFIGTPKNSPEIKSQKKLLKLANAKPGEIAVYTINDNLYLAGNSSRATLYAVYTFLQKIIGVRWLWAGDSGEFIPKMSKFELPNLALNQRGAFEYRGFHLVFTHVSPEFETWMARNFINIMRGEPETRYAIPGRQKKGIHIMFSGHNVTLPQTMFAKNPKLFAMNKEGKRTSSHGQLCLSNPEVKKLIAKNIRTWLLENPEVEIMSLFPSDNKFYCQCKVCASVSLSTNWFSFISDVATLLKGEFPNVDFSSIAYQGYLEPPTGDLSGIKFIEYCQYDNSIVHPYSSKNKANKKSLENISKWRKTGIPLGIYGYDFDLFVDGTTNNIYLPFYRHIPNQVRKCRDLGMKMLIPEVPITDGGARDIYQQNRLSVYLYAQLMWDPDQKLEELMDCYNKLAFGEISSEIRQIQETMMTCWENSPIDIVGYGKSAPEIAEKVLDKKTTIKVLKVFEAAKKKVAKIKNATERRRIGKNVEFEAQLFDQWLLAANMKKMPLPIHSLNLPYNDYSEISDTPTKVSGIENADLLLSWSKAGLHINLTSTQKENLQLRFKTVRDPYGRYRLITIKPDGSYSAKIIPNKKEKVPTWDPKLEVSKKANGLKITFPGDDSIFKIVPNERWVFSVNYGKKSNIYPPNAKSKLSSFGNLYFNKKTTAIDKKFVMFLPNKITLQCSGNLMLHLLENGWNYSMSLNPAALNQDLSDADVICFMVPKDSPLDQKKIGEVAKAQLNAGKVVIFAGYHVLPLDKYLNDPSCKMIGSGWVINRYRDLEPAPGKWSTDPENLLATFKGGVTPSWGYTPATPAKWKILAYMRTQTGSRVGALMVRRYGKGLLVVCGGDMGTGADYTIFGSARPDTLRMLFNNLLKLNKNL